MAEVGVLDKRNSFYQDDLDSVLGIPGMHNLFGKTFEHLQVILSR